MNRGDAAFRSRALAWWSQLCAAVLVVLALADGSAAQTVAAPAHVHEMRLSFQLDDALIHEARRAYVWRIAWTAIYAGLAVGAAALAPAVPDNDQPAYWVGAISSAVSALYCLFFPLEVEASTHELATLREPHGSDARRARARAMYASAAVDEGSRVSWPWHVANAVMALIPGAILWLGYDLLSYGLMQFGAGVVLGEAAFLTQPTRLTTSTPPGVAPRPPAPPRSAALGLTITF